MKETISALSMGTLALFGSVVPSCSSSSPAPPRRDPVVIAFCGVEPSDPKGPAKLLTIASTGVDATMGPCRKPGADYSPSEPGQRYASPDEYLSITVMNANAGMKTVVYDARIWSDDADARQAATDFWSGHAAWVLAFDMGDEFNPFAGDGGPYGRIGSPGEWETLRSRWEVVQNGISAATGIPPFTNHLPWAVGAALTDLPSASWVSFDSYGNFDGSVGGVNTAASIADATEGRLMCAVNALKHLDYNPTRRSIRTVGENLNAVGCDHILVFGGERPIDTPGFPSPSMVDSRGRITAIGLGVRDMIRAWR